MTRPDHDDYDGLAVGWALHALEPAEEHTFFEHLATCSRCQVTVQESQEALGELAYDVPLVEPPPYLLDRIRLATGAIDMPPARRPIGDVAEPRPSLAAVTESDAPPAAIPLSRPTRSPRWAPMAMAAAVVLIALLGWNVVLHNQASQAQQLAAQRKAVIVHLTGGTTRAALRDGAGHTIAYVLQHGTNVEVVADGLAPNNRSTSTYVLWAIQGSGQPPQAVGTFDVVRKTLDVRTVTGQAPLSGFSGFAVSREQGHAAPERPSQVVATGAVPS